MLSKAEVIVLVGPMGVGKSTVGKKLARSLDLPFRDTDVLITDKNGPIENIFKEKGEEFFRNIEHETLKKAVDQPGIVATGGGAVLAEESRTLLRNTTVIYLATDGKHMASRLRRGERPLIRNGLEDWMKIYEVRKPIYESIADLKIDTSNHSLQQTVGAIREGLGI